MSTHCTMHPYFQALVNAPISKPSKRQYIRNLMTLRKISRNKPLEEIVINPKPMIQRIRRMYANHQTRKAFACAIKAVFKYVPDLKCQYNDEWARWHSFYADSDKTITDRIMAAEPTEREKENWVRWTDVLAKEHELSAIEFGSNDHLLLAMYSLIEPLRQDFGTVAIVYGKHRDDDERAGNFVVIPLTGPATLVLNNYKTQKVYGTYRRQLPETLSDIIRTNLKKYPRSHLFVDSSGKPYVKSNSFTRFSNRVLERLFHKKFTVSMMRHSYISNINFNESTPSELFEKSKNMAHSIAQQQLYRRKVPDDVVDAQPLPAMSHQPHSQVDKSIIQQDGDTRFITLVV